jgi:integrase
MCGLAQQPASIKAFLGSLVAQEVLARSPARELIPPEREYKEPRFLTTQEYQTLLRACARETRDSA